MRIFAETEQQAKVLCSGTECRLGCQYKKKVSGAALNRSTVRLALNLWVLALISPKKKETFGFLAKEIF